MQKRHTRCRQVVRKATWLQWGYWLLLLCVFASLSGCQSPPQTRQVLANPPNIPVQYQISKVPFYPQQQFFCGPTTLTEVAGFYGISVTPETIAPSTFIPSLEGTLQIEMSAATRQLGMLAYTDNADLSTLLQWIAADIPVIVLQNNGVAMLPRWHYAVVIGYDLNQQQIILHSGVTENYRLDLATFERTWQRGNYWFLAMLPPKRQSQLFKPFIYTKAAQDLVKTGPAGSGVQALQTATVQWPEYWLPYFLLGNAYYEQDPKQAAYWFGQGQAYALEQVPYLNNHALALSRVGCQTQAKKWLARALALAPNDPNLQDTAAKIAQNPESGACELPN